jgi:hypothetical protein
VVALIVAGRGFTAVAAEEPTEQVRALQMQNELYKKTIERLQEEIKKLKAVIKGLKNGTDANETGQPATQPEQGAKAKDSPTLGVHCIGIDAKVLEAFKKDNLAAPSWLGGVLIVRLGMDSPAHKAGVEELDVITSINGTHVRDTDTFVRLVSELQVGKPARLGVRRMGERKGNRPRPWVAKNVVVTPETRQDVLAANSACPLELVSARLRYNVINQPTVSVTVKNKAAQNVVAYSVAIHCWDRFDKPVVHSMLRDDNVVRGISQRTIAPGRTEGKDSAWTLHMHDNTAKVKIVLTKVKLEDGTEWKPGKEEVSITAESQR